MAPWPTPSPFSLDSFPNRSPNPNIQQLFLTLRQGSLVELCLQELLNPQQQQQQQQTQLLHFRCQTRSMERLPGPLASLLLRRLLEKKRITAPYLRLFQHSTEDVILDGIKSVDATWLSYIGCFSHLRTLSLRDCTAVTNAALSQLRSLSHLEQIDLSGCRAITSEGLGHVISSSSRSITSCHLSRTKIGAAGVRLLASLTALTDLDLSEMDLDDSSLLQLAPLTQLQHINLQMTSAANATLNMLRSFPNLRSANLALTAVTRMPLLPSVTSLDVSGCNLRQGSTFRGDLAGSQVGDDGADTAGEEAKDDCKEEKNVADHERGLIDESPVAACQITALNLRNAQVADDTWRFLSGCSKMQHLNLWGQTQAPQDLGFISCMMALQTLDLGGVGNSCRSMDEMLEEASRLPFPSSLTSLSLASCHVTHRGLSSLLGLLPRLHSLNLDHTLVGDDVFPMLALLPSLRCLSLEATQVTGSPLQQGNESPRQADDAPSDDDEDDGDDDGNDEEAVVDLNAPQRQEGRHVSSSPAAASSSLLSSLPLLSDLNLLRTSFSTQGIRGLLALTRLQNLALSLADDKRNVMPPCALELASLPNIQHLSLHSAYLSKKDLRSLRPSPSLKVLDLGKNSVLGIDSLQAFREAHPPILLRFTLQHGSPQSLGPHDAPSSEQETAGAIGPTAAGQRRGGWLSLQRPLKGLLCLVCDPSSPPSGPPFPFRYRAQWFCMCEGLRTPPRLLPQRGGRSPKSERGNEPLGPRPEAHCSSFALLQRAVHPREVRWANSGRTDLSCAHWSRNDCF